MNRSKLIGCLGLVVVMATGCDLLLASDCEVGSEIYSAGESFRDGDDCNTCICNTDGEVSCTAMGCMAGCEYYGALYAAGETFPAIDSCNTCTCSENGGVSCTEIACPLPAEGFEEDLTIVNGCADMHLHAVNAEDTIALELNYDGVVAAAYELGENTTQVLQLPAEDLDLKVEVGSELTLSHCNDVMMGNGPYIARTYYPISGTITVSVELLGEPQPWESPAYVDVLLEDVVFEDASLSRTVTVPLFEMTDVYVGWLPG